MGAIPLGSTSNREGSGRRREGSTGEGALGERPPRVFYQTRNDTNTGDTVASSGFAVGRGCDEKVKSDR